MASTYPISFDSISGVVAGEIIDPDYQSLQSSAINNLETTLGLLPYGPYSTVALALSGKRDLNYAVDSGSANTYVVTLSPALSVYTAGVMVVFKAANANTGSSTLNVSGLGAVAIKKNGSTALAAYDINAGQIVLVMYDGTNFQMTYADIPTLDAIPAPVASVSLNGERITNLANPSQETDAVNAQTVQNGAMTSALDTGSTNAYAVSLSPAPSSYTPGMMIVFKAANANTGASTINVNLLGSKAIVKNGAAALSGGEIPGGLAAMVVYDGTNFQLIAGKYPGNPLTTLGDTLYGASGGAQTRLPGNSTTTRKFMTQTGTGSASAAPAWGTIAASDVPTLDKIQVPVASVSLSNQRISNLANPTQGTDAVNAQTVQNAALTSAADTGTANVYVVSLSPTPSSYAQGMMVVFKAANANTGASTLNVNSLGSKSIVKYGSTSLGSGDIQAGEVVTVVYDGTNFQKVSPTPYSADGTTLSLSGTTFSINTSYPGQTSIVTVGTVTSGTWHGSVVGLAYGGTGASLSSPSAGTLLAGNGTALAELAAGSNGTALIADSTQTLGVRWGPVHAMATVTQTSNYSVQLNDTYIRVDATSNNVQVTLPDASTAYASSYGNCYCIKRLDGSANTVTIATTSSQVIDGAASLSLSTQYQCVRVVSNGSGWDVV